MRAFLTSATAIALALGVCASSAAANTGFTVETGSEHMIATTTRGTLTFSFHNNRGECDEKYDACFAFAVADGTDSAVPVSASSCDTSQEGTVVCPSAGIKSLLIMSAGEGGTITSEQGGQGNHGGVCSSIPVMVKRKAHVMSNITVNDGCMETVVCTDKFNGDVEVDGHDKVVACSYYMRNNQPVGMP